MQISHGHSSLSCESVLQSGKAHCCLTNPHFKLLLEIMDVVSSGLKITRFLPVQCLKGNICDSMGVCICEDTINAGRYMRFWSNMCYHQDNVFFIPTYSSKTMPRHFLQVFQERLFMVTSSYDSKNSNRNHFNFDGIMICG